MTPDETKRRNYMVAGSVGGFLLPLAGLAGALAFWASGDRDAALVVAAAALLGTIAYFVFFVAL